MEIFEFLETNAPMLGIGFGVLWAVIAFMRKHPILAILSLLFCTLAGRIGWIPTVVAIVLFGWMAVANPKFLKSMAVNFGVSGELMSFLWERKLWWMIPMVVLLLCFGLLMVFASASGVGPFIYTLF